MSESEGSTPPDVGSGMILRVLKDSPMKLLQCATIGPGFHNEYPECHYLIINRSDFWYFSELLLHHKLKLNYLHQDERGNDLYSIDEGSPIILKSN